jgi:hypothetical protein
VRKVIKCGSRSISVKANTYSTLGWMYLNDLGTKTYFAFSAGSARKLAASLLEAAEILDDAEVISKVGRIRMPKAKKRGGGA